MKFDYDLSSNYLKYHNIAQGISINKKRIKKKRKKKIVGFLEFILTDFLSLFLILIIGTVICLFIDNNFIISIFTLIISILFTTLIAASLLFVSIYFINKKEEIKGSIIIDKDGISDIDSSTLMKFNWSKIDFVVLKKDVMVVILKHPYLIIVANNVDKEKVKQVIRAFDDKLLIIESN